MECDRDFFPICPNIHTPEVTEITEMTDKIIRRIEREERINDRGDAINIKAKHEGSQGKVEVPNHASQKWTNAKKTREKVV
jgi:hypothetical protein